VTDVEEKVAFLEGRLVEQSNALGGIPGAIASLEARLDRRIEKFEQSVNQQIEKFEQSVNQRFESAEQSVARRFERVDQRFDTLDAKMSRQFMWLAGMLLTTLVAVVAALVTR